MYFSFLYFSCPSASASTFRTMFNEGSGGRQPYFVGSMTPNNPCNSASSVLWKPLEEEEKGQNQTAISRGPRWNRSRENMKQKKLFSRALRLHSPASTLRVLLAFSSPWLATLDRCVFYGWQIQNKGLGSHSKNSYVWLPILFLQNLPYLSFSNNNQNLLIYTLPWTTRWSGFYPWIGSN